MKKEENSLDRILNPSSVALIGASKDPMKWGHMLLSNIMKGGYQGKIYPINPSADEIDGLKCYPNIKDVPEHVDLAILVVPGQAVPQVTKDCVDKGVSGAVVITSGFGETGAEGKKLQDEMVRIARQGKLRIIGPNCMGICSSPAKLSAIMIPFLHERGDVAFISQSGGYGEQLYLRAASVGIGISKFISSGNEADLIGADYLEYFGNDDSVKLIAMYIEGVRDGRRFLNIAREVSKKKPIVVMKVGTTEVGGRAAASHTGAMAGSDKIYDDAFKQMGILRIQNAEEMFDVIKALLYCPLPKGNRMGVIANSGGVCVETIDRCVELGLDVPTLPPETQQKILKFIPSFGNPRNPIDLTATLDMNSFLNVPGIVLQEDTIDGLITLGLGTSLIHTMLPTASEETLMQLYKGLSEQLIKTYKKSNKPVLVINPAADIEAGAVKIFENNGVPVYLTPQHAARAMATLYKYKKYLDAAKSG